MKSLVSRQRSPENRHVRLPLSVPPVIFLVWVAVVAVVFTRLTGVAALLTALFDRTRWLPQRITALWARAILASNPAWRLTIDGQRHLPTRGAYILASNHASLADIIVLFHLRTP